MGTQPPDQSYQKRKRRASKACSGCQSRKIRCDVLKTGLPCSRCHEDGFECALTERKQRGRMARNAASQCLIQHRDTAKHHGLQFISLPPHIALHQIPHYPFFQDLTATSGDSSSTAIDSETSQRLGHFDLLATQNPRLAAMPADDVEFLKRKGAFSLPPRSIFDELVSNYFKVFHPFFPVVDKTQFLKGYMAIWSTILKVPCPSLLLVQAIIFTSSSSIPLRVLEDMSFGSRQEARSTLYQRVKLLYEFDYEEDDVITIQALLLMSQYYPSMTMQKHTWFWVQQAISLAQGAGLHRDPGQISQRGLWSRMWWSCVIRDRLISLGTGRPMHINSLDCNVLAPTPNDIYEEGDTSHDQAIKIIFSEFLKLCQYMEGVLSLAQIEGPNPDRVSIQRQVHLCESTLQHWLENLDPVARRSADNSANHEEDGIYVLYRTVLHMTYNIVMITLNQSYHLHGCNRMEAVGPPLPQVLSHAEDSTELALDLINRDLVSLSPTVCVTAILPPLIVQILQRRTSSGTKASIGSRHFDICMRFLQALGEVHWHASFYYEMFSQATLSEKCTEATTTKARADWLAAYLKSNITKQSGKRPLRPRTMEHLGTETSSSTTVAQSPTSTLKIYPTQNGTTLQECERGDLITDRLDEPFLSNLGNTQLTDTNCIHTITFHLEDWLNDFGYFYNDFPSA